MPRSPQAEEGTPIVVAVPLEAAGERLDRVLAELCTEVSRSALQRWIEEGRVTQAGAVAHRKTKAIAGAEVEIIPAPPPLSEATAQAIPLDILFEDDHLIALDKAAGMVVHPAPGHPDGTLVNALLHHTQPSGPDPSRPGIVHRLDKDTSGVMIVAKSSAAHERLVQMFQQHDLERAYLALVLGHPPPQITYDTFHGRHRGDRKRFSSRVDSGRRAITHVERLESLHGTALVRCRLETGRTHQIRVHLADHRHPVLGDPVYGKSIADPAVRAIGAALGRQALHAERLAFAHPITGERLSFATKPPADFHRALDALRTL